MMKKEQLHSPKYALRKKNRRKNCGNEADEKIFLINECALFVPSN